MELCREDMICVALLTGSDYTVGIHSIGPVAASEIIKQFPTFQGLLDFKKWASDELYNDRPVQFSKKLTNLKKKLDLKDFPDSEVYDAYMHPVVDFSNDKFSWGTPQLDSIRSFMNVKAGWSDSKIDEALIPAV
jgi:DNA excision repair protein ERCC-5